MIKKITKDGFIWVINLYELGVDSNQVQVYILESMKNEMEESKIKQMFARIHEVSFKYKLDKLNKKVVELDRLYQAQEVD